MLAAICLPSPIAFPVRTQHHQRIRIGSDPDPFQQTPVFIPDCTLASSRYYTTEHLCLVAYTVASHRTSFHFTVFSGESMSSNPNSYRPYLGLKVFPPHPPHNYQLFWNLFLHKMGNFHHYSKAPTIPTLQVFFPVRNLGLQVCPTF